jgi:hypothetical protein
MIPVDDLDQLLEEHFSRRAERVQPAPDPGPEIRHRSHRLVVRRRRQQAGGLAIAALALLALLGVGLRSNGGSTRLGTADDSTTSVPGACSVADTCQPASASSLTVSGLPAGYQLVTTSTSPANPASNVIRLTYSDTSQPPGPLGMDLHQLTIQVTTQSASATDTLVQPFQNWSTVSVGARTGRFDTVTHQAASLQVDESDLEVQLSPTVVVYLSGDNLDQRQMTDIAASITVQP